MNSKKKFVLPPTILLIITIIIGLTIFEYSAKTQIHLQKLTLSSPSPSLDADEPMIYNNFDDKASSLYPNFKHYVNTQAHFTIDYPTYLTRTEFYPEGKEGAGIPPAKNVYFCKTPLDVSKLDFTTNKQSCVGEGFRIQFSQHPGWGGGCEPENYTSLTLMGKSAGYCNYPTGFGQLYYGKPRGEENNPTYNSYEFLITGEYGKSLTNAEIKKIMTTFRVSDN